MNHCLFKAKDTKGAVGNTVDYSSLTLLPAGVLLPIIANHKIKWYQALAVGILVSAIIEFSQLIFMRGLFEWDDMIHNGLGCMIGCLFANIFRKKKNRD